MTVLLLDACGFYSLLSDNLLGSGYECQARFVENIWCLFRKIASVLLAFLPDSDDLTSECLIEELGFDFLLVCRNTNLVSFFENHRG